MPSLSDLDTYYTKVRQNRTKYPEWRYGQVLFNTLFELDSNLANEIRGTKLDPFYVDRDKDKLDAFITWLVNRIYSNKTQSDS